jgi:hypothetical protein
MAINDRKQDKVSLLEPIITTSGIEWMAMNLANAFFSNNSHSRGRGNSMDL